MDQQRKQSMQLVAFPGKYNRLMAGKNISKNCYIRTQPEGHGSPETTNGKTHIMAHHWTFSEHRDEENIPKASRKQMGVGNLHGVSRIARALTSQQQWRDNGILPSKFLTGSALKPDSLSSNPATHLLCDHGQVTSPHWVSVSSSLKWAWE